MMLKTLWSTIGINITIAIAAPTHAKPMYDCTSPGIYFSNLNDLEPANAPPPKRSSVTFAIAEPSFTTSDASPLGAATVASMTNAQQHVLFAAVQASYSLITGVTAMTFCSTTQGCRPYENPTKLPATMTTYPTSFTFTNGSNSYPVETWIRTETFLPASNFRVEASSESEYVEKNRTIQIDASLDVTVAGNPEWAPPSFPIGTTTRRKNIPVTCRLIPIQLTATVEPPNVDFGLVQINKSPAGTAEILLKVTSGASTPSGTIVVSSPDYKTNGRIALGGGEIQLINKYTGTEIIQGDQIAIASRDMSFLVKLNSVGATTGAATSTVSFNMTVN